VERGLPMHGAMERDLTTWNTEYFYSTPMVKQKAYFSEYRELNKA
jgi:hypothetical protein